MSDKKTSDKVASQASDMLRNKKSSKDDKSVAGSALSQKEKSKGKSK